MINVKTSGERAWLDSVNILHSGKDAPVAYANGRFVYRRETAVTRRQSKLINATEWDRESAQLFAGSQP